MNLSYFLARRLYKEKDKRQRVSKLAMRIATLGVSIGLAVMLVSVCIVWGFKDEISGKVKGFASHIYIENQATYITGNEYPVVADSALLHRVARLPDVAHVQRVSNKSGLLKTDDDFKVALFKGIGAEYDTLFLHRHLKAGHLPDYGSNQSQNDIVISQMTAQQLHLTAGDRIYAYFFENGLKTRRFTVAGVYETNMTQFDDNLIFCHIQTANRLSRWRDDQASAIEVQVTDFDRLDDIYDQVLMWFIGKRDADNQIYTPITVTERYGQIFDWLGLLDLNIWIILGLMALVACVTMISGLLIIILEKTSTIGVLKAMGARNGLIRSMFLKYAVMIMGRGLLLGNLLGLGFAAVQSTWHLVELNPQNYYIDHVPILFDPLWIVGINVATVLTCVLAMIGPSFLVTRIKPAKAIKFD